ncbi:MAG: nucleotidyltransferase domain-containing protein [Verrucomicrobiota bacterium]
MHLKEQIEKNASSLCQEFGIKRLGIFGSVARGEESEESDIDFFAEFDSPTPESMPERYFGFIDAASRVFERSIQLVTPRMLKNPHLIRSVERDLVTVYD